MSRRARAFGRPVRASVAARTSATARLRRLASTGAAWLTDSEMRLRSASASCASWVRSTDPITSPPTSDGTQIERRSSPHRLQASSGSRSLDCSWGRPSRTARHEFGAESTRRCANADAVFTGVVASSRFWLLFRFSTTTSLPGSERSRWRLTRACASVSVSVTCRISANSRCVEW